MDGSAVQEEAVDSTGSVRGDGEDTSNKLGRGDMGDWFILGMNQQLLERNCLALRRKLESEPPCFKKLGPGLRVSLRACCYHAKEFSKFNSLGADWTFRLKPQLDDWSAIASLFLENHINCNLLYQTGDTNTPIELAEREWPPKSLSRDWFDFDTSFNLLFGSKDALYETCRSKGLMYPEDEDEDRYRRDLETDYDLEVDSTYEDHWKLLRKENRVDEGKAYWRKLVVRHLKDLTSHQEELSFKC